MRRVNTTLERRVVRFRAHCVRFNPSSGHSLGKSRERRRRRASAFQLETAIFKKGAAENEHYFL